MADLKPLKEPTKPFNLILAQLEGGVLHDDLSDELRDAIEHLEEHAESYGKAGGTLTLKLSLELEGGLLTIKGDISSKLPKASRKSTVAWVSPGNNVSFANPKQPDLPMRSVPSPSRTPQDAGAALPAADAK